MSEPQTTSSSPGPVITLGMARQLAASSGASIIDRPDVSGVSVGFGLRHGAQLQLIVTLPDANTAVKLAQTLPPAHTDYSTFCCLSAPAHGGFAPTHASYYKMPAPTVAERVILAFRNLCTIFSR